MLVLTRRCRRPVPQPRGRGFPGPDFFVSPFTDSRRDQSVLATYWIPELGDLARKYTRFAKFPTGYSFVCLDFRLTYCYLYQPGALFIAQPSWTFPVHVCAVLKLIKVVVLCCCVHWFCLAFIVVHCKLVWILSKQLVSVHSTVDCLEMVCFYLTRSSGLVCREFNVTTWSASTVISRVFRSSSAFSTVVLFNVPLDRVWTIWDTTGMSGFWVIPLSFIPRRKWFDKFSYTT